MSDRDQKAAREISNILGIYSVFVFGISAMWVLFSAFNLSFFCVCAKLGALRVFLALLLVVLKFFLNGYLSVLLMVAIDWLFVALGFKVEPIDLVFVCVFL